jgi:hypothetical protein
MVARPYFFLFPLRECFEIQTLKIFLAKRVHNLRRKPA